MEAVRGERRDGVLHRELRKGDGVPSRWWVLLQLRVGALPCEWRSLWMSHGDKV